MKIFTMFLHIMVGQNPEMSNAKECILFSFIWCDVRLYLHKKKCHNMLKNENIFKISLKCFLIFMKFIVCIKHYDSIWLEYFVSHVKSLIIIILKMSFFRAIYNNLSMWKKIIFKGKERRNMKWAILQIFISNGFWFQNSNKK
jgi:hypothetical protein